MSKAAFPVNDLLRRRLQTGTTVVTLTLSVASTLFLLLFSNRLGVGFASTTGTLTLGLTAIFSQFIAFIGALIFIVGAVLTSFIVFLMMAQRTRDFGLIKAAGCPNSLVGGYFMTELLTITLFSCLLGVFLGFLADFAVASMLFSSYHLPNFLFAPLVFGAFFTLAFFFGLKPILKAAKMSAIEALSPVNYYGLSAQGKFKPVSRAGLTWRVASRSLFRRQTASIRIIILLSIVFILLTVCVAGGVIAGDTTSTWVQKTVDTNTVAIAHPSVAEQYKLLYAKFTGTKTGNFFNYSDPQLAIPKALFENLENSGVILGVDSRLVLESTVREKPGFDLRQDSSQTRFVGGRREGESLVIGVDPAFLAGSWSLNGRFLTNESSYEAVIGDSIVNSMYVSDYPAGIANSNPLAQGIEVENASFKIVGVCVDPINNGFVTYVPIENLQNSTGIFEPNLLLLKLADSIEHNVAIGELESIIQASGYDLVVFDLRTVMAQNDFFLSSMWRTIMLLPLFTLVSASFCLMAYMMLAVDEQRQEFGVLRAVGAKPPVILAICAIQSAIVLISGLAVGISLGVIITALVLMAQPVITSTTIITISGWLFAALIGMFIFSLYPAFRTAKAPILKILS